MILDAEEKRELDRMVKDAETIIHELRRAGLPHYRPASQLVQRLMVWQQTAEVR